MLTFVSYLHLDLKPIPPVSQRFSWYEEWNSRKLQSQSVEKIKDHTPLTLASLWSCNFNGQSIRLHCTKTKPAE
jgi:uncharacterized protein (DUF2249 family)